MARETWVQSQVESYQRLKKWYLMPPCLTLSINRHGSRVKWRNPGKRVAPFLTPWCSSYRKGNLQVTLDYGRQLYFLQLPWYGNLVYDKERSELKKFKHCWKMIICLIKLMIKGEGKYISPSHPLFLSVSFFFWIYISKKMQIRKVNN